MSDTNEALAPEPEEGALNPVEQTGGEPAVAEPEQKPEAKPADPKWFVDRIAREVRKTHEERRAREEMRVELEELRQKVVGAPAEVRQDNAPQPRQQAPAAPAEPPAEVKSFNDRCNTIADKVRADYGAESFTVAIQNWNKVGLDLNDASHRNLLDEITRHPDGAALYHHIGTDPDLASRLLDLSGKEQYAELREIARAAPWKAAEPRAGEPAPVPVAPPVSQAPRPAGRQPGPARTSSKSYAEMTMEEFKEARKGK